MPAALLNWTDDIYFTPFVGPEYHHGLVDGVRVLLLGESHYATDVETRNEGSNCTIDNFESYLTCEIEPGNGFFGKLQRIVTRNAAPTAQESNQAWRRIAYANFVQCFVGDGARQRPTANMWKTGQPALREMVERLKPDVVLVLGSETWDHITEGTTSLEADIAAPRHDRSIWLIPHSQGVARSTWIYHPSTNYDSTATAIAVFDSLLNRCEKKS